MTITAQNISYWIGQQPILHRLSFTIHPGELTVVLGQNGAGKSTFLKVLSGEKQPTMGQVMMNNQNLHKLPVQKLALIRAVLSQQYSMSVPFTCGEIVLMGRYPHFSTKPTATDNRIVRESMEEMQIEHLSKRNYQQLSGGEQQRVQMARVLAQLRDTNARKSEANKKLLLLDEPTSSMDVLYQQLCLSKARALARQGLSVVVILHDLNLAAQFADTIFLLKQGQMVKSGNVREVLQPSFISDAYNMEVDLVETDEYDFPILVPAAHRNQPALIRS